MSDISDPVKTITVIKQFLAGKLDEAGLSGYVVGLSGGIDSALSAALAVAAVGPEKVYALLMPYRTSSEDSRTDAVEIAGWLGIEYEVIDISPMIDAYFKQISDSIRIRAGNKMARERMSILFDVAHRMNRLVLGTGNRTEICLGYTTWYGDAACSVNPIGELYKGDIRSLAGIMNVPDAVLSKTPSADLWTDQTDEGEIGLAYAEIDLILHKLVDEGQRSLAALEKAGLKRDQISRVVSQLNRNAFKRALPPLAPLGRAPIPENIQLDN